jgi:hypothetical protein
MTAIAGELDQLRLAVGEVDAIAAVTLKWFDDEDWSGVDPALVERAGFMLGVIVRSAALAVSKIDGFTSRLPTRSQRRRARAGTTGPVEIGQPVTAWYAAWSLTERRRCARASASLRHDLTPDRVVAALHACSSGRRAQRLNAVITVACPRPRAEGEARAGGDRLPTEPAATAMLSRYRNAPGSPNGFGRFLVVDVCHGSPERTQSGPDDSRGIRGGNATPSTARV